MKKFWVCCFAAVCMVLAGCAGGRQEGPEPAPPEQVQQGDPGGESEAPPQTEEPDPAPEADEVSDRFAGTWRDPGTPECRVNISGGDGDGYTIEITWDSGSQEKTAWALAGTYDETWEGIAYVGAKYVETTGEEGAAERTLVPDREEITGLIFFEDDGTLHWIDDFDHAGDDLSLERE